MMLTWELDGSFDITIGELYPYAIGTAQHDTSTSVIAVTYPVKINDKFRENF